MKRVLLGIGVVSALALAACTTAGTRPPRSRDRSPPRTRRASTEQHRAGRRTGPPGRRERGRDERRRRRGGRLHRARRRDHRHQLPRRRGRLVGHRPDLRGGAGRVRRAGGRRRHPGRSRDPGRERGGAPGPPARGLGRTAARPAGRCDRVRPRARGRSVGHGRDRVVARSRRSPLPTRTVRSPTAARPNGCTPTRSRPTPPSTRATREGHWSTWPATWWGSTARAPIRPRTSASRSRSTRPSRRSSRPPTTPTRRSLS